MSRLRARHPVRALLLGLLLAVVATVVATGHAPCAFAWLTGLPCPSCGSGRSVRAFLHGDWATAWQVNPLGIPAAALLGLAALGAVATSWRSGSLTGFGTGRRGRFLAYAASALAVLEVMLWVLRFMGMLGGPVPV